MSIYKEQHTNSSTDKTTLLSSNGDMGKHRRAPIYYRTLIIYLGWPNAEIFWSKSEAIRISKETNWKKTRKNSPGHTLPLDSEQHRLRRNTLESRMVELLCIQKFNRHESEAGACWHHFRHLHTLLSSAYSAVLLLVTRLKHQQVSISPHLSCPFLV